MTRIILAALLGAIIYFVWQMLTWMALPIHGPTVAELPNDSAVRELLVRQDLESGVYISPWGDEADMQNPESDFMKQHAAGPIFSIYYRRNGIAPMAPLVLVHGFFIDFLAVALGATLLSCASDAKCFSSYFARVGFFVGLGVFLALAGHVAYYNWMHFEAHYTAMFVVDAVVGWFLVGLVTAAIIKPCSTAGTMSEPLADAA